MSSEVKKCGVVGHPIKHSLSPVIFDYWFEQYNIPGCYELLEAPLDLFADFIDDLRSKNYVGVNVTIPFKTQAYEYAAEQDEVSGICKASNILSFKDEKTHAANSDYLGFYNYLASKAEDLEMLKSKKAILIGAGGASSSILYALLMNGFKKIEILNRTESKAETLKEKFHEYKDNIEVNSWSSLNNQVKDAGLIINSTALGMDGYPQLEIDLSQQMQQTVIYDIVYRPLETELLKQAQQYNHIAIDGLGMLLHQAVPAFEKWFGIKPTVDQNLYDKIVSAL